MVNNWGRRGKEKRNGVDLGGEGFVCLGIVYFDFNSLVI